LCSRGEGESGSENIPYCRKLRLCRLTIMGMARLSKVAYQ
jgi:hypothetical protein